MTHRLNDQQKWIKTSEKLQKKRCYPQCHRGFLGDLTQLCVPPCFSKVAVHAFQVFQHLLQCPPDMNVSDESGSVNIQIQTCQINLKHKDTLLLIKKKKIKSLSFNAASNKKCNKIIQIYKLETLNKEHENKRNCVKYRPSRTTYCFDGFVISV